MRLDRLGIGIRRLRRRAGMSQTELGDKAGVHRMSLTHIEAGKHLPSLTTLANIASALDCQLEVKFKSL